MPTPDGPLALSAALNFSAMTSNAWSQETGVNSPSLAKPAVAHPQQRRGQPVGAVHDLGEEVALDAVEAAIDLGVDVAVGRDHAAVLDRDHDAAAGAAEPAGRLVPGELRLVARHHDVGGLGGQGDARNRGRGGGGLRLDDPRGGSAGWLSLPGLGSRASTWWKTRTADSTPGRSRMAASRSTMPPSLAVSRVTTTLPSGLAPWTSTPGGGVDHGPATRPNTGGKAIAPSGQASPQVRHSTPWVARQPAAMRMGSCRGTDPPRSSPRREMAAGAPRIAVTARASRVGRR